MKTYCGILFLFLAGCLYAQKGHYVPAKNTDGLFDTIPFTFNQKMLKLANMNNEYLHVKYNNLDTVAYSLSADIGFILSEKAIGIFLKDLLGDSLSKQVHHKKEFSLTSDLKLNYSEPANYIYSDSVIHVKQLCHKEINKDLPLRIFLNVKKEASMFTLYVETPEHTWYYFSYHKYVMIAVSSNELFNAALAQVKQHDTYQVVKCAPVKRAQFLRKLQMVNTSKSFE